MNYFFKVNRPNEIIYLPLKRHSLSHTHYFHHGQEFVNHTLSYRRWREKNKENHFYKIEKSWIC